ncbi:uncharacterized protein LOC128206166 [Mya arenaria]|uniref:uncharacterized protein LOC128206166 n=1 Tax=Mya arenaria TaxID=6604 RepID=UPI0022E84638|nr:uncharacterized protein LOC128206166 [Mya arenaria]
MGKCKAQKETKVSQTEMAISLIRNAHSSVSEIENDSELPEIQIPIKQEVQKQDGTVCDLNLMRSRRGSVRSKEKQNACIQSEEVSLNEVAHLIEEVKSEVTDLMDDTENGGFGGTDQPICLESSSMTRKRDCSRSNTSKRKLIRKAPKSDENFNCKICDKTFSTKYVYQKHMAVHSGEKPYSCEICGALFSLREYLTSHMTCHSAERKFKCDECGAAFFRRGNLIAHKQSHTDVREFKCEVCSKYFKTKASRDAHLKHHSTKTHVCLKCGKGFINATLLRKHVSLHEGHKPYTCEKCGKCFPYNQSLQEHMLRHKGEMPVSCDRCGKRFNNVRQLKAHSKYHELRTDFHCSLCNLYYESLKSLKKHCYMSHATDHSCEFCGEKFSNKRVLASHRFKQHKDKRESRKRKVDIEAVIEDKVMCTLCKRVFINKECLADHLIEQHDWKEKDVETFFQAKDTDRIITLRLQEEKGKENYKVYYKDEEMDVFVTVKDGDKGLTNESADEIVDREQSEEVKLVTERKTNKEDVTVTLTGDIDLNIEDNSVQYKCIYVEGDEAIVTNSGDGCITIIPQTSLDIPASTDHETSNVENILYNIVEKPNMAGTINENEKLYVIVPDNSHEDVNIENRLKIASGIDLNTVQDTAVLEDETNNVEYDLSESDNHVLVEREDHIVVIVDKESGEGTFTIDGQEFQILTESIEGADQAGEKSSEIIEVFNDHIGEPLHNPVVIANDGAANLLSKQKPLDDLIGSLQTNGIMGSLGNFEPGSSNPSSISSREQLSAGNIPQTVEHLNSYTFGSTKAQTNTPSNGTMELNEIHTVDSDYRVKNRISNSGNMLDTNLIPISNMASDIANFEQAIKAKAESFQRVEDYNNFLDKMMLSIQKAKIEQNCKSDCT